MSYFIDHPKLSFALLTSICLVIFWLSIPLPRVDNQLIGSDGTLYYVYLPSFWLDHDLDFTDEYSHFIPEREFSDSPLPPNKYTVGTPLLWSPFFMLAHLIVWLINVLQISALPTNGYSYVYQAFTLSGSIIYGGVALWFAYNFVRQASKQFAALLAVTLTVFSGNLVYYMFAEPSMSHTTSAFCSSLFFLTWSYRRHRFDLETAVLYGLLAGLMALVRPQDGVFLILPFLDQLPTVWQNVKKSDKLWLLWLRNGVTAAAAAFIVFSLQLIVWHQLFGGFFRTGYSDEPFYWFAPKLGLVLFSAQRGLFVWHPVFLLSILGSCLLYKRDKQFAAVSLIGFAIQWYIISSWHSWYQGDAFGGRMFIVCLPLFALGLAHLFERLEQNLTRTPIYVLGTALLIWNFLLFVEYRFDLVFQNTLPTWYDVTLGRVVFIIEFVQNLLLA